jgi:DNA (cytosine-5)-methyltransferase 1
MMLETDYTVTVDVLNALDHGVPQDRERVFMIGFRRGHVDRDIRDFCWPHDGRYAGAKTRFSWPTVDPFGGDPPMPEGIPIELMVGPIICDPAVADLPNGCDGFIPYSDRFGEIDEGDDSRKSFKRLHRWRYSPAAAYGNNEVHLHPTEPRRIMAREAMRIQTIPDDYAFPIEMPLSHKFKTIGNGVPVRLAQAVAKSVGWFINGA